MGTKYKEKTSTKHDIGSLLHWGVFFFFPVSNTGTLVKNASRIYSILTGVVSFNMTPPLFTEHQGSLNGLITIKMI